MTTTAPPAIENDIHIRLNKCYDPQKINAYLVDIFTAWERGRHAVENGTKTSDDEYQKIFRRTCEFLVSVASAVIEEASPPIIAIASKLATDFAFADGLAKGKAIGALQPIMRPAAILSTKPPALDSEAILKTIGGELRKMFEAGLEQGKGTTDAIIEAGKLAKPSGEIVKVQRNGAGDIVGAVKQLIYDGNGGA